MVGLIGELVAVFVEHPVLAFIALLDLLILTYILAYLLIHIYQKHRPDREIAFLLKRFTLSLSSGSIKTIEELYSHVIDAYLKKGLLGASHGRGFRAREEILSKLEGYEREVVSRIFEAYEKKVYGGGLENEEAVVSALLDEFRSV